MILKDRFVLLRRRECIHERIDERRVELLKPAVVLVATEWKRDEKRSAGFEHAFEFFHGEDKLALVTSLSYREILGVHRVVHADVFDSRDARDCIKALVTEIQISQVTKHVRHSHSPESLTFGRERNDGCLLVFECRRREDEIIIQRRSGIEKATFFPLTHAREHPWNFDDSRVESIPVSIGQRSMRG